MIKNESDNMDKPRKYIPLNDVEGSSRISLYGTFWMKICRRKAL
jgi:hypothetical protein